MLNPVEGLVDIDVLAFQATTTHIHKFFAKVGCSRHESPGEVLCTSLTNNRMQVCKCRYVNAGM